MTNKFSLTLQPTLRKLALATALCVPAFAQAQPAIDKNHVAMLDKYCSECHNQDDFAGGIAFDLLETDNVLNDAETWEKVLV
ncbi:MAG: hypothetical protein V4603_07155, partial [Pseudomonadota bacterium]